MGTFGGWKGREVTSIVSGFFLYLRRTDIYVRQEGGGLFYTCMRSLHSILEEGSYAHCFQNAHFHIQKGISRLDA